MIDVFNQIKIYNLKKERELIKANKKAWAKAHASSHIDDSIARTFKAYESTINQLTYSIRKLEQ
jgi:hypothetical protein